MKKCRKGQSTLEYVIILAAVIGAIIAVGALLRPRIENSYNGLSGKMENAVGNVVFINKDRVRNDIAKLINSMQTDYQIFEEIEDYIEVILHRFN